MKLFQFLAATALLVSPGAASGALIVGNTADQFIAGPSTSGPQDGTGTSLGNAAGVTLKVGRVAGSNADAGRNAVYVFQLPNLGAVANPFTSAALSFGITTIDNNTAVNVDLYGLGRRDAAPTIAVGDYYFANGADSTDATRLQVDILTPTSTPNSIISTDGTGSANLLAFLNAQYAGGVGVGEYVYLRLNVDGALNNIVRGYNVNTADVADAASKPTITFEAIPEPATFSLAALGCAAVVLRRRSR